MACMYYSKEKDSWIVETDNNSNYTYSVKKYGKYAEEMAKYTKETNLKIKNYFEIKNDYMILYTYFKPENIYLEILIDKNDYDKVKDYYWSVDKHHRVYYVRSEKNIDGKKIKFKLHRVIMGINDSSKGIDHINGNGLDNRRCNLRIASTSLNNLNKQNMQTNNTSGIRGVRLHKNAWVAEWVDYETKKSKQKSFSISKYGDEKAKQLAIEVRKEMEEKNNYFK